MKGANPQEYPPEVGVAGATPSTRSAPPACTLSQRWAWRHTFVALAWAAQGGKGGLVTVAALLLAELQANRFKDLVI